MKTDRCVSSAYVDRHTIHAWEMARRQGAGMVSSRQWARVGERLTYMVHPYTFRWGSSSSANLCEGNWRFSHFNVIIMPFALRLLDSPCESDTMTGSEEHNKEEKLGNGGSCPRGRDERITSIGRHQFPPWSFLPWCNSFSDCLHALLPSVCFCFQ